MFIYGNILISTNEPDSDAGDHEYGTDSFDFLDLTVLDDPFFVSNNCAR